MIRSIKKEDIPLINNLINDKNYIVNEYELDKNTNIYIKDNQIIAFISYKILYERAEIDYIFVKEEERKKGIASILLNDMINECARNNVETIDLEVNSLNKNAINLYQKFDFKVIGKRDKYYNGIDALLMMREVRK